MDYFEEVIQKNQINPKKERHPFRTGVKTFLQQNLNDLL